MTKSAKKKYTLAEAKLELARPECERTGHSPAGISNLFMTTKTNPRQPYPCKCGQYVWSAVER